MTTPQSKASDEGGKKCYVVPSSLEPLFAQAAEDMGRYFDSMERRPEIGRILLGENDRFFMVNSEDFAYYLQRDLTKKFGSAARFFIYDLAFTLGREDCRRFVEHSGSDAPLVNLAAGPIYFAYTGMATVELLPGCNPVQGDDFLLAYYHHHSFEADAWLAHDEHPEHQVCLMNAGYSAGWCTQAFGTEMKAQEMTCRARGDKHCFFVMAPARLLTSRIMELRRSGEFASLI
jgi:son of sevenless-like protein